MHAAGVNVNKTKEMCIEFGKKPTAISSIMMNKRAVKMVQRYGYPKTVIDKKLCFEPQVLDGSWTTVTFWVYFIPVLHLMLDKVVQRGQKNCRMRFCISRKWCLFYWKGTDDAIGLQFIIRRFRCWIALCWFRLAQIVWSNFCCIFAIRHGFFPQFSQLTGSAVCSLAVLIWLNYVKHCNIWFIPLHRCRESYTIVQAHSQGHYTHCIVQR